jgi:hypothetical protein
VGLANGLDALTLGLRALDVGPGDEVIVPSNTYVATWLAVSAVGATIVPVEPDARTYNLDPERLAAAVTPRTRVVLPVHLYGQPADMDPVLEVARAHGLRVLEDAAQAHGATYRGRPVGALGDVTAWSFYPSKNLGAFGDAGAITTNDAEIADRVRVLRNYGSRVRYVNEVRGANSRLEEIHAAVLRVKLRRLREWNARRRASPPRTSRGSRRADWGCVRAHVGRSRVAPVRRADRPARRPARFPAGAWRADADPLPDPAAPAGRVCGARHVAWALPDRRADPRRGAEPPHRPHLAEEQVVAVIAAVTDAARAADIRA